MPTNTITSPDGTTTTTVTDAQGKVLSITQTFLATPESVNAAAMQANIQTHIGQLETWLAANPNGAVLTAAQTKFLAQTLIGVGRVLLNLTSTIGGAT